MIFTTQGLWLNWHLYFVDVKLSETLTQLCFIHWYRYFMWESNEISWLRHVTKHLILFNDSPQQSVHWWWCQMLKQNWGVRTDSVQRTLHPTPSCLLALKNNWLVKYLLKTVWSWSTKERRNVWDRFFAQSVVALLYTLYTWQLVFLWLTYDCWFSKYTLAIRTIGN